MSLGIVIKAPEGLVLAAESRVTLSSKNNKGEIIHVNFDNATKLLTFSGANNNIGAVTYGAAAIGFRTAHSFIPEFETKLKDEKLSVKDFSKKLSDFFLKQWNEAMPQVKDYKGRDMTFVVAGYDEGEAYGIIYNFEIPRKPEPIIHHPKKSDFGITWGGQRDIVDRLMMGYDSRFLSLLIKEGIIKKEDVKEVEKKLSPLRLALPIQFMPLQDCINLAALFNSTTIKTQELTAGLRGCGGEIDLAIITRNNPLKFIQRKQLVISD